MTSSKVQYQRSIQNAQRNIPRFFRVRYFSTFLYGQRKHSNRVTVTPGRAIGSAAATRTSDWSLAHAGAGPEDIGHAIAAARRQAFLEERRFELGKTSNACERATHYHDVDSVVIHVFAELLSHLVDAEKTGAASLFRRFSLAEMHCFLEYKPAPTPRANVANNRLRFILGILDLNWCKNPGILYKFGYFRSQN
jgi:hypothetical protein